MLESMTLTELEQERTRVNNEIKRVFCTWAERTHREGKIHELSEIRRELDQGIKDIRSLPLSEIKRLQARIGA